MHVFKVTIVSLSVCCHCSVTPILRLSLPLFVTTILPLQRLHCFNICLIRQCSVRGFDCLFFCLLRRYAFSSWFPIFIICLLGLRHHVSLSLRGFHCFSICLLRHYSVLGFDCLVFRLLRHHDFSSRFLLVHSLSVSYVTAVFWTSTVSSSVLLRHYMLSTHGFHCLINCLLRHSFIPDIYIAPLQKPTQRRSQSMAATVKEKCLKKLAERRHVVLR